MSSAKFSETREARWDNIKAVMILCVVLGHVMYRLIDDSAAARSLYFFVYIFHMPVFIFLSGMFSKKAVREKNLGRVCEFLLIYLVMKFLDAFSGYLAGHKLSLHLFWEAGPGWYAFALAVFLLVTMALFEVPPWILLTAAIFLGCISGYDTHLGDHFASGRICTFYPFFLAGYYMDRKKLSAFLSGRPVWGVAVLLALAVAACSVWLADGSFWLTRLFRGKYSYGQVGLSGISGAGFRLGYYVLAAVISLAVMAALPAGKTFFTDAGQKTMAVFICHPFLLDLFFRVFHGKRFLRTVWPVHYVAAAVLTAVLVTISLVLMAGIFDGIKKQLCRRPESKI